MSNTKTGGPAFPAAKIISGDNYNPPTKVYHSGMTLRQYAAIKLKVPDSGDDWLDDMIRKSLRDDFAAKAMQAQIASYGHGTEWPFQADPSAASTIDQNGTDECAIAAYWFADAMMEVRQA